MDKLKEFIEELEKLITVDMAHPWASGLFMIDQEKYVELKDKYVPKEEPLFCNRCGKQLDPNESRYKLRMDAVDFIWCEDCYKDFTDDLNKPESVKLPHTNHLLKKEDIDKILRTIDNERKEKE